MSDAQKILEDMIAKDGVDAIVQAADYRHQKPKPVCEGFDKSQRASAPL